MSNEKLNSCTFLSSDSFAYWFTCKYEVRCWLYMHHMGIAMFRSICCFAECHYNTSQLKQYATGLHGEQHQWDFQNNADNKHSDLCMHDWCKNEHVKPVTDEQVFYDKFLSDKFYLLVCTRNFDKFFYDKCTCHRKNCQTTNFVRLYGYGSTKKTCQSNLSIWCDWPAGY